MTCYALGAVRPRIHPTAFVHPDAVLIGDVEIAAEASVWPGAVLRADFAPIRIGARTSIQDGCVLHTDDRRPTLIGADCVVGHNTHLEGCTVEDRCLIGSGSVTLFGATIGTGSIVGAQALVTEDLQAPAGALLLGVPARVVRTVDNTAWIDRGVDEYRKTRIRHQAELSVVPLTDCLDDTAPPASAQTPIQE